MFKKITSVLLVVAMLLGMMPTVFAEEAETPDHKVTPSTGGYGVTIAIGSATATQGGTVDLPLSIDYDFTEKVTELKFRLKTDSAVTLNGATLVEGLPEGLTLSTAAYDMVTYPTYLLKMEDGSAFTLPKGEIIKLNYTVSADAPAGDIAIAADLNPYTYVCIENDTTKYDNDANRCLPGNITVAAAADKTPLTAPTLAADGHTIAYNTITLAAVTASGEDETATAQYRYSSDGIHWNAWQTEATFSGLYGSTKYYFQARYQTATEGKANSAPSATLELTTSEAPWFNVSIRVIGTSLPSSTPSIASRSADYKGAEYQNWLKTTSYEALAGSNAEDLIRQALTDADFTFKIGKPESTSITAPTEYGGQTVTAKDSLMGNNSRWMITVKRNGEYVSQNYASFSTTLEDGDEVILHFVFNYIYERNGSANEKYTWAVSDLSVEEYTGYNSTIALINAIGRVTPDSRAAIEAARAAYDALSDTAKTYVTNYEALTAAEAAYKLIEDNAANRTALPTPVIGAGTSGLYSIAPAVTVEGVDAANYTLSYRISLDGTNWGPWLTSLEKLLPNTTYYVQTMAQTNDWTTYGDSAVSETATATTAGADATTVTVDSADALKNALNKAPVDGTLLIVDFTADVIIDDIPSEMYTVTLPAGSNIVLTSSNGSKFLFNEPGRNSYIGVTSGTTVTVKGMEIGSIHGSSALVPGNEWQNALRFMANDAVINLVDAKLYCQNGYGIIGYGNGVGTLNIYSGAMNALLDTTLFRLPDTAQVNLLPIGNIMLEGGLSECKQVNILNQFGVAVVSGVATKDFNTYTQLDAGSLNGTISYDSGLRLNTDSATAVPPTAMDEIVILPADDPNAATADVTYVIGDNQISFTYKDRANAIYQIKYGKNYFYTRGDSGALGHTKTYTGLKQDTEYTFTVHYSSLDNGHIDAEKTVTLRTTYTPTELTAPTLSDEVEKTETSITVTAPATSGQDGTAVIMYRISPAGMEQWSQWQTSATFEGLTAFTEYDIQAMYDAQNYLWLDSAVSNTVTVKTKAPTLTAPTLDASGATSSFDTITVTAPAGSSQDVDATVWYRVSTDGETWGDWTESNVLTGLAADTTYYIQAYYVTEKAQWLNSEPSQTITVKTATNESAPHFKVESVSGKVGTEIKVIVSLNKNPGIIATALKIHYDDQVLELVGYEDLKLLPNGTAGPMRTPFYFSWEDSTAPANLTKNGNLLVLTFKIADGCQVGDTSSIWIEYNENDVYDYNMDNVKFATVAGTVTVTSHTWGAATYTWSHDHSTCTATHTCTCCETPVTETETVDATTVTVDPTETEKGSTTYTATFEKTGFETQLYIQTIPATGTLVQVDTITGCIDGTVKVTISFQKNPGVVGAELKGTYDADILKFVAAENGAVMGDMMTNIQNGSIYISWSDAQTEGVTDDGVIVTLTFKIKDTASVGDVADIEITSFSAHDTELNDVEFNTINGKVTVEDHRWSDWQYTWSDDHKTCTATRTMTCGCGKTETQTVKTVVADKNCTAVTYLAHFTIKGAEDQNKAVTVSDHDYVISANGTELVYTCSKCGESHTETVEANAPKFTLSQIKGRVGDKVEVTVSVTHNAGFIMAKLAVNYDETVLKLVEVKNAGMFDTLSAEGNVITLGSLDEIGDTTADGTLMTLVFEIIDEATEDVQVGISYANGAIRNYNGENLIFAIENGAVEVYSYELGDVNGDGVVDIKDVTILRRYLAGTAESMDLMAADANRDGSVDIKDVTILRRYLAGIASLD